MRPESVTTHCGSSHFLVSFLVRIMDAIFLPCWLQRQQFLQLRIRRRLVHVLIIDFRVEDIVRSFAFVVIRSVETLMLESLAALGDHDTGQASVGTRGVCKSIGGVCVGSCCVGGRLLLSGLEWAGERCHDVHVSIFVLCCDQTLV